MNRPHPSWSLLEAVFADLGRAVLLLDREFRVVLASERLDAFACDGAHERAIGQSLEDLFGSHLMATGDNLALHLERDGIEEGRRAFLKCPFTGARLVSLTVAHATRDVVRNLHERAAYVAVVRPVASHAAQAEPVGPSEDIVARSPAMLRVVALIEALHRSDATVLITGESGTGKEVVARAMHAHSPRRRGSFVAINCAALPATLLESELFGHVRGSFTGAVRDRVGRFEAAGDGTVFLDEIGDVPVELQVKLLRVLQEHAFERVGDSRSLPFRARVIAATNVDLARAIVEGRFREDLYYRLRVVPLHLPPLRQRPEDIEPLACHLLARVGQRTGRALGLSPDLTTALSRYAWPGNVREMENALEYGSAIARGQTLHIEHMPPEIRVHLSGAGPPGEVIPPAQPSTNAETPQPSAPAPQLGAKEQVEKERIEAALRQARWRRDAAADALGISRTTLWRRMKSLHIES